MTKAPTTTVTNIKQGGSTVTSIASGTSVTDAATVSGQVGAIAPTGTVSFSFFTTANCTGTATSAGSPALSGRSRRRRTRKGPLAAGSYSFQATYSGDANYVGSTGSCEPLTVDLATAVGRRRNAGDRDHEEPEVADDRDRRDGELHDRRHEHRHPDADERQCLGSAVAELQPDELVDPGAGARWLRVRA